MSRSVFFHDLIDREFGRLIVVDLFGLSDKGRYLWLCNCECGNQTIVPTVSLVDGSSKSCGCLRKETIAAIGSSKAVPVKIGARFGQLTILEALPKESSKRQMVKVRCDCGKLHVTSWLNIRHGTTKSCGHLKKLFYGKKPSADHPFARKI